MTNVLTLEEKASYDFATTQRQPRVTVRGMVGTNISGSVTWTAPTNPTPLPATWTGKIIRGVSPSIVAGMTPALADGDRVFLGAQNTTSEIGVYLFRVQGATNNLYKMATLDACAAAGTVPVWVREGTLAGWHGWTSGATVPIDGKPLDFVKMDFDDFYVASDGADCLPGFQRCQEAFDAAGTLTMYRRDLYPISSTLFWWNNCVGIDAGNGAQSEVFGITITVPSATCIRTVQQNVPSWPISRYAVFRANGLTLEMTGGNTQAEEYNGFEHHVQFDLEACFVVFFSGCANIASCSADAPTSSVTATCVFDSSFAGAAIGALTAQVTGTGLSADQPAVIFSNSTVVAAGSGTHSIVFNGPSPSAPYTAPAGTLTTIVSGQSGWTSVTNPSDATPGVYRDGADNSTARHCRWLYSGRWNQFIDVDDTNNCVFESCSATFGGQRNIEGTFAQGTVRLTSTSTSIGAITAGQVTVQDNLFGLLYTNVTGGTLGSNSTLDLMFQAPVSGSNYNQPLTGTITIINAATTIPLPGVTVNNSAVGWLTQAGTDRDGGGFYDSAFITNKYSGCHTSDNWGYNYHSDGAGTIVFDSCYEEQGSGSKVIPPSLNIGGSIENWPGFHPQPGPKADSSGWNASDVVGRTLGHRGVTTRSTRWISDIAWEFYSTEDSGGYQLVYYDTNIGIHLQHCWVFNHQFSAAQVPLAFTTPNHERGTGIVVLWSGVVVGNIRSSGLVGTAPPATSTTSVANQVGVYNVGDHWDDGTVQYTCTAKDGSNNLTWRRVSPYNSARGAVTSNVASLAAFTVAQSDVTYIATDTVLLAGQSTKSQNWVYTVGTVSGGTAPLTRVTDGSIGAHLTRGLPLHIREGTQRGCAFLTTPQPITLDTTALDLIIVQADYST